MALKMRHTITKTLLSMEEYYLLEETSFKVLVLGLQLIDMFHQLADK